MSTLNVDKVDPSTGTTLELGTSGDTVNLGSGVTAGTGFGGDLSFGGDTFGANKVIGANDAYSFSLETSGNTALTIDSTGAITKPLQPAFSAYMSADMTDITTNTDHTIIFDTERFDVNADFNTGTYTFTAPVTGKYAFMKTLNLKNADANGGYYHQKFITSNETYNINVMATPGWAADVAHWQTTGCVFADMDASDTCYFTVHQQEGTAQADVRGGAGWSSIQGWLAS